MMEKLCFLVFTLSLSDPPSNPHPSTTPSPIDLFTKSLSHTNFKFSPILTMEEAQQLLSDVLDTQKREEALLHLSRACTLSYNH